MIRERNRVDPIPWLQQRGNQAALRHFVERTTGRRIDKGTTSRWARGEQGMTAATEALIMLLIREPGLIDPAAPKAH